MIHRFVSTLSAIVLALVTSSVVACSSESTDPPGPAPDGKSACEKDTRKDIYVSGLSKKGGAVTVKLLDAKPAPLAKGSNELMLQVLDAGDKPVDGATVTFTPFMPDHGHGSSAKAEIVPMGSDGKYQVKNIWLPMAGLWSLTFAVAMPGGGATEEVSFSFCLDG